MGQDEILQQRCSPYFENVFEQMWRISDVASDHDSDGKFRKVTESVPIAGATLKRVAGRNGVGLKLIREASMCTVELNSPRRARWIVNTF